MFPNQLFAAMPAELAGEILNHAHQNEKPLYRQVMAAAAASRKFRPALLEKMPRTERHQLMRHHLTRATPETIAEAFQLVSAWLIHTRSALLSAFLDHLKIPHDGAGCAETFPPAPPRAELESAVAALLAAFPPAEVAVYLHTFNAMPDTRWKDLDALLDAQPALKFEA